MRLVTRLRRDECGQALLLMVFLIGVLSVLAPVLMETVSSSSTRSEDSLRQAHSHAAADAGLNDYIAKLLDDNQYYLQYLAPGESTRHSTDGHDVASVLAPASPTPWPTAYGRSWTYPNGKDAWVDLGNGYSYNLQIVPPQTGANATDYVDIEATGKPNSSSTTTDRQVIEELIRPASVADFQMLSNATVCYGSDATTRGKIYSTHDVEFGGTAYADIYAEGSVSLTACDRSGPGQVISPAQTYDRTTIRTVIKQPVNFSDFQVSLTDVKRAAQNAGGIYLYNPSASAWQLTFNTSGQVTFKSCRSTSSAIEKTQPTCDGSVSNLNTALLGGAGSGTLAIPTNGAVYSDESMIIGPGSSTCGSISNGDCIKGRVTVASGQDVVIGDDIDYVTPGTDVLGVIAQNNVWVASWTGNSLSWRAAALAENGVWSQPNGVSNGSHSGTMTFTGSTATNQGGAMSMFAHRSYNYDTTLQYLQPPWFPTLQSAYTVLLYRSLPNSS